MNKVLGYAEENTLLLFILFSVMVMAAVFWNLYRREKRKEKKLEGRIQSERSFYRAYEKERKNAYLLIQEQTLDVLYVSPNFKRITKKTAKRKTKKRNKKQKKKKRKYMLGLEG